MDKNQHKISILTKKIEEATGKKVVLKEQSTSPFTAQNLLIRAVQGRLINIDEYSDERFKQAAQETVDDFSDWPEGQGFGSSDMTAALSEFLSNAGVKSGYVDNKLTRIAESKKVLKEAPKMSLADIRDLNRYKSELQTLSTYHPQDDTPYSQYDGYTVSDSRKQIKNKIAVINKRYGILPKQPSDAALQKRQKDSNEKRKKEIALDKAAQAQFPDYKVVTDLYWDITNFSQPGMNRTRDKFHLKQMKDALQTKIIKSGFTSANQVKLKYREILEFKRNLKTGGN